MHFSAEIADESVVKTNSLAACVAVWDKTDTF